VERQHGVVTAQQLGAAGLSREMIRRRAEAGMLYRVHRRVYAVGHRVLSKRARYLAAVLACGPGAALSHRAAGDWLALRRHNGRIDVTVPRTRGRHPGLVIHHSRTLAAKDVTEVAGIPVTSVSRTLLDLAAVLSARDLGYALDRAERLQVFDLAGIEDVLGRARGRRGARALRTAIDGWHPADTRSELEDRHRELVSGAGLEEPLLNVVVAGERHEHTVDAYWPSHRVIVQLDGFGYHRTRRDRERDAATDADLELAGYRVLRLTWDDVTVHGARTVRRLQAALTARGAAIRG
jgi:hypothetical protein